MVEKLTPQDIDELGALMLLRFNDEERATYQKMSKFFKFNG